MARFSYSRHQLLQQLADFAADVFARTGLLVISGASGTGKSFLAREVHEHGSGAGCPLITQNAASFDDNRFESQLFGHVKGAFTGAVRSFPGLLGMATGGTLCIEDLDVLTHANQAKVLRFLDHRKFRRLGSTHETEFNGGLIFTSRFPLNSLMKDGALREDLFFRVLGAEVVLWPLLDRHLDFETIFRGVVAELRKEIGTVKRMPTDDDQTALRGLAFPGNIHGLRSLLVRSMVCGVEPLKLWESPERSHGFELPGTGSMKGDMKTCEKLLIERGLRLFPYSRRDLADFLGISKRSLLYKLKEHGLS